MMRVTFKTSTNPKLVPDYTVTVRSVSMDGIRLNDHEGRCIGFLNSDGYWVVPNLDHASHGRPVFSDVVIEESTDEDGWPTTEQYRKAAERIHGDEGTTEFDLDARISRSEDGGAYVQAWCFVYHSDMVGHELLGAYTECDACGAIQGPECEGAACHACGGRGMMELTSTEETDNGSDRKL